MLTIALPCPSPATSNSAPATQSPGPVAGPLPQITPTNSVPISLSASEQTPLYTALLSVLSTVLSGIHMKMDIPVRVII